MSIVLKVEPGVLKQMAADIEQEISHVEGQFQALDSEITKTKGFWEGSASDLHQNRYNAMKDKIQESVKRLKSNPTNLLTMAGIYEETETTVTEASQALDDDVIV